MVRFSQRITKTFRHIAVRLLISSSCCHNTYYPAEMKCRVHRWYNRIKNYLIIMSETVQTAAAHRNDSTFQGLRYFLLQFLHILNVHFTFVPKAVMSAHSLFIFWGKSSENILNSFAYEADGLLNTCRLFPVVVVVVDYEWFIMTERDSLMSSHCLL